MTECLFCKIAQGKIKADIVHQDEKVIALNDIDPKAPHHVLIIPHQHIATVNDLVSENNTLVGHMIQTAKKIASERKIADDGYRLVLNCNRQGGQAVYHLHLHLLGGRQMNWPPG